MSVLDQLFSGDFERRSVCGFCLFAVINGYAHPDTPRKFDWHAYRTVLSRYVVLPGHIHLGDFALTECFHSGRECEDPETCECEINRRSVSPCAMCGTKEIGQRRDVVMVRHGFPPLNLDGIPFVQATPPVL